MSPQLRQKLQKFLEPYAQTGVLQNMVQTAFSGTPLLAQVNAIANAQGYVMELVKVLDGFGDIEEGVPGVVRLLEGLQDQVGVNKQYEIEGLLREIAAEPKGKRKRPTAFLVITGIFVLFVAVVGIVLSMLQQSRDAATQEAQHTLTTQGQTTAKSATAAAPDESRTLTPLEAALQRARAGVIANAEWQPFVHDFGDGVKMVLVPQGCFLLGSSPEQIHYVLDELGESLDFVDDELNGNEICLTESFWLDETEVTQADFERLGGTKAKANHFDGHNHPVEQITWFEAQAFCEQRGGRLPTEVEWEYAARGPDALIYPWGNEWQATNKGWDSEGTAEVKEMTATISWVGAYNLSGNVWEWTLSRYDDYPYEPDGYEEKGHDNPDTYARVRVIRGASGFNLDATHMRSAFRSDGWPNSSDRYIGFRCVRFE